MWISPISWSYEGPFFLLALAVGYLIGSIPFGVVFTRLAGMGDIRTIGSGNIGATNVLRTGNKFLAAATMLADALKGTLAVYIGWTYFGETISMIAGIGAFLGHLFPIWLKFRGGKGAATYLGVILGLFWPAAIAYCVSWLAVAVLFRISSLAAIVATLVTPLFLYFSGNMHILQVAVPMTILIFIRHRANIQRLLAGTESRIGAKT
jgi:glycerol-3-phosphate acyltransferase PlsY